MSNDDDMKEFTQKDIYNKIIELMKGEMFVHSELLYWIAAFVNYGDNCDMSETYDEMLDEIKTLKESEGE